MKKLKNSAGFSLIEMLLALAVLVLLVVGMQSGLDAGVRAYGESIFESNSAAMAGIINSAMSDALRYAEDIKIAPADGFERHDKTKLDPDQYGYVFTNYECGVRDAYFEVVEDGTGGTLIKIANLHNDDKSDLVTTGAYPDLKVSVGDGVSSPCFVKYNQTSKYFEVTYQVIDMKEPERIRDKGCTVRLMNPEE